MGVDTKEVVFNLTRNYYPFSLLSARRAKEALDAVRVLEIREGESFTLTGGKGRDYLYVIEGEVRIDHDLEESMTVCAESRGDKPLFMPPLPYKAVITAVDRSIVCHADSNMFDYLILWDELESVVDPGDTKTLQRMRAVSDTLAFQGLRMEALVEAFRRMKTHNMENGRILCEEGEPGAAFYVFLSGKAEAYDTGVKVADLVAGDVFGVMAHVEEHICGATVRMTEDGELLLLPMDDYRELMSTPLVREASAEEAREMIDDGAVLLDVRYRMERDESFIPGSVFIPLHDLRGTLRELDPKKKYVAHCRSGKRSKVAAQIMEKHGLHAVSLKGGILGWPFEIEGDTY